VRGGSVLFEPGAIGGIFTGCFFIDDPDQEASLATAIQQTLDQVTIRFYGGHIFAAGGDLGAWGGRRARTCHVGPTLDWVELGWVD
jgi:hypothetical protein